MFVELYLDKKPNIYIHLEDGRSGSKTFNDVKDLQRAIKAVESKVKGSVEKAVFERIGRDWIDVTELEDITDRKYLVHIIRKLVLKGYIEYKRGRRNKLYVKRKEV